MSMLPQFVRRKTGLLEQFCEHGIGHPTRASAQKLANTLKHHITAWLIHGCDGCCSKGMDDTKE